LYDARSGLNRSQNSIAVTPGARSRQGSAHKKTMVRLRSPSVARGIVKRDRSLLAAASRSG